MTLPSYPWTSPYTIPIAYYREGFRAFQKKYVYPRTYITMGIFALLLVTFIISAVQTPDNRMQYFLMMVCLAGIFINWYNPRRMRRHVLDIVRDLEGQRYISTCDGVVLRIQTVLETDSETDLDSDLDPDPAPDALELPEAPEAPEESPDPIPETRILLENAWVEEFPEFYLVCEGKRMFYIVPKQESMRNSKCEMRN